MNEGRTFKLHRTEDPSGVSGLGIVAVGVQFPTGRCVTEWLPGKFDVRSFNIYLSIEEIEMINGHDGRTTIVWDDTPEPAAAEHSEATLG
ncbi:MAG TPA: hypothetical protein VJB57_19285 [Dehalococcoidia bacterium]|nr:hypothetical protein [Dehalococcoidia bacterium]